MKLLDLDIPIVIGVDDYHEFDYIQGILQQLNPAIKVRELGCAGPDYLGLVYLDEKDFEEAYQRFVESYKDE